MSGDLRRAQLARCGAGAARARRAAGAAAAAGGCGVGQAVFRADAAATCHAGARPADASSPTRRLGAACVASMAGCRRAGALSWRGSRPGARAGAFYGACENASAAPRRCAGSGSAAHAGKSRGCALPRAGYAVGRERQACNESDCRAHFTWRRRLGSACVCSAPGGGRRGRCGACRHHGTRCARLDRSGSCRMRAGGCGCRARSVNASRQAFSSHAR